MASPTSKKYPKRMLLMRTDRIGDVVITTPIIRIIKAAYPDSEISFLTGSGTHDLLTNHPDLHEIIIYNKKENKSWLKTIKFARTLRKKKFDVIIIFNPKHRSHWIAFMAGIPMRIGYNAKGGYLLTHRISDKKGEGKHSEAFYNEDLLSFLNIPKKYARDLFAPPSQQTNMLLKLGIQNRYAVINVSSGCPSKTWPIQNFSRLVNLIRKDLKLNIILIGSKKDCKTVQMSSSENVINLSETLSLIELTQLFRGATVHITSDTGPMHIAAAVNVPIIAIFGRTHPGLGPSRWAPLNEKHIILQKDIGCDPCLAHNCKLDFDCLKATKVENVYEATKKIIAYPHH